jgi:hypothetical protein
MIVTTGSRIRKDTFSSAAPMDVILTEAAATKGINDVATLLQTTTVFLFKAADSGHRRFLCEALALIEPWCCSMVVVLARPA